MPATTARLLLGNPHPNDGGLSAIDTISLTEGDRSGRLLQQQIIQ